MSNLFIITKKGLDLVKFVLYAQINLLSEFVQK